jgi:UTP--glucose-1-phosphate uridylyltransferase
MVSQAVPEAPTTGLAGRRAAAWHRTRSPYYGPVTQVVFDVAAVDASLTGTGKGILTQRGKIEAAPDHGTNRLLCQLIWGTFRQRKGPPSMSAKLRTVIIPAAGKGTRLLPLTRVTAKELLPVYDRVAIDFAMDEAVAAGAERILVVLSPSKQAIRDYLAADHAYAIHNLQESAPVAVAGKPRQAVRVEFVIQEHPRGLGDAILCCKGKTLAGPVGVILPDDVVFGSSCLADMAAHYSDGHMVAAMNVAADQASQYGIFQIKSLPTGRCIAAASIVEKPAHGTAPSSLAAVGRYILDPMIFDVLDHTPPGAGGEVQLTDAIAIATKAVPLTAFRFSGERFDCGNHEGLLAASLARQTIVASQGDTARRGAKRVSPVAGLRPATRHHAGDDVAIAQGM